MERPATLPCGAARGLSSRRGSAGRRRRPLRLRPRRHPAKSGADGITARSARAGRGLVPRGMRRPPDWRRKQVWLARHGVSTHATRPRRGSASRLPTRHLPPPCRHLSTSRRLSTGQKLPPIPAKPPGKKESTPDLGRPFGPRVRTIIRYIVIQILMEDCWNLGLLRPMWCKLLIPH